MITVLVSGGREWTAITPILRELRKLVEKHGTLTVIHGGARGADTLAGEAATILKQPYIVYPADWKKHGRAAGPIRNIQMLETKPDLVLAFHPDLKASFGTKHCVEAAIKREIPVRLITK